MKNIYCEAFTAISFFHINILESQTTCMPQGFILCLFYYVVMVSEQLRISHRDGLLNYIGIEAGLTAGPLTACS